MGEQRTEVGWAMLELMGHRKLAGFVTEAGLIQCLKFLREILRLRFWTKADRKDMREIIRATNDCIIMAGDERSFQEVLKEAIEKSP